MACFVGLTLACSSTLGCGAAVYEPARSSGFELDPTAEINDDDVRKAFEARPQMRDRVQVAYYSFDADKADEIDAMLEAMPGVAGTYRIPALMATGERRFEEHGYWGSPAHFSLKKVRLMAARAHCDLLVIFDYGNKVSTSANGLAAFDVLLVPTLFLPFLDVEVKSAMDSFVIDTRNGYLYAHVDSQKEGAEGHLTIYSSAAERMVKEQWPGVLADTATAMRKVLETERANRASVSSPSPAGVAAESGLTGR